MNSEPNSEELEKRKQWFERYMKRLNNHSIVEVSQPGVRFRCPCCGYKTLDERGGFKICTICFWEDDGQDDQDANVVRGGPNGALSLNQARENFQEFGACEQRFIKSVRRPHDNEI